MKKISFFLLFIFVSMLSFAQDTWSVFHNKIEIFNTGKSDPVKNIVSVTQVDLNQPGIFLINYTENKSKKNWVRHLAVYDGAENVLMEKKGDTKLKLSNEALKDWFTKSSVIKIFTWTLPADPELAARIRVRRLHLCTIELK